MKARADDEEGGLAAAARRAAARAIRGARAQARTSVTAAIVGRSSGFCAQHESMSCVTCSGQWSGTGGR
jgi:hypothetical protein